MVWGIGCKVYGKRNGVEFNSGPILSVPNPKSKDPQRAARNP